jgi:putative ABC transport system ATP-binding protein
MTGRDLIRFDSVHKTYRTARHGVPALVDVTFGIPRGGCVVVAGDAGAGKSTLLRCATGLVRPTTGQVIVAGTAVGALDPAAASKLRLRQVGYLQADPCLVPGRSVWDNIVLPPAPRPVNLAWVAALVDRLGLTRLAHRSPADLSVRLRRRVALARALAADPALVVADEPTGGDPIALKSLVRWLRADRRALLVATRDAAPLSRCADQVLRLSNGRLSSRPDDHGMVGTNRRDVP